MDYIILVILSSAISIFTFRKWLYAKFQREEEEFNDYQNRLAREETEKDL